MVKRLDHLNFSVDNLDESIQWYGRVFGFAEKERGVFRGTPWAILQSHQAILALYERKGAEFLSSQQQKERKLHGFAHIGFTIDDEDAWKAKIQSEHIVIDHEWEYPHSHSWYLNDPTGHEIEVVKWQQGIRFPSL